MYLLEPWGPRRDNFHAATIAAILAAAHHNPAKGPPPSVEDFMYKDAETARDLDEQRTVTFLNSLKQPGTDDGA